MRIFSFLLLIAALAVACAQADTSYEAELMEWQTRYKAAPEDTAVTRQFAQLLFKAATAHPEDSISPFRQLQSALLLRSLPGEELEAVVAMQKVRNRWPDHEIAAEALFQEAYTWDEFIGNKDEAKKNYDAFIKRFPTHPRSATAKELLFLLENNSNLLDVIDSWKQTSNTPEQE